MKKIRIGKKPLLVGVIILVIIGGLAYWQLSKQNSTQQESEEPVAYYSSLTGEQVSQEESEQSVLGVMIENSEFARPQTGLSSAGIVFEAQTEGGITRYLALYQANQPETVGPVRSLRPHFVDWLMGFDAAVAHVGGSARALQLAEERNAKSLTEFTYPEAYYRDSSREAPHDVFVRTQDLRNLQQELGFTTRAFDPLPRKDDSPSTTVNAETITLDFSAPAFLASFTYDPATNRYSRSLAGSADIDTATNKPITVKNVVVLITNSPGEGVNAVGSGKAQVFMDGTVQDVSWKKSAFSERVQLMDSEGNEVALNRGNTWFAVLTSLNDLNVTATTTP